MTLSLAEVLEAVGGRLSRPASEAMPITGVSTDTRTLEPGSLFVALRGERFDGHDHLSEAFERGAAAAVVQEDAPLPDGLPRPVVVVPDTVKALGYIARHWRRRHPATVLGLTGSSGKTTTKELVALALGESSSVLKNELNLNNEYGVPLTLLRLRESHRFAVVEMGMRGPGEIAWLAQVAEPEVGVITNVGTAHLGRIGSREGIARAKGELLETLPPSGHAILPDEGAYLDLLKSLTSCAVTTFGLSESADVRAVEVELSAEECRYVARVAGRTVAVRLPLPGHYNVVNSLTALAAAHVLGVDLEEAAERLACASAPALRGQTFTLRSGALLLSDVYNANPESVAAALEALRLREGRRVVVLGDMLELGPSEAAAHRAAGERAARVADLLVAVGPLSRKTLEAALESGLPADRALWFRSNEEAAGYLKEELREGDIALVKGSRGMRMETLVEALRNG